MHATIARARTADASKRPRASPPLATGLSSKSPMVAPSGRVRMKASQNRMCGNVRVEIQSRDDQQGHAENERAALVAEAAGVGQKIAKGGAER